MTNAQASATVITLVVDSLSVQVDGEGVTISNVTLSGGEIHAEYTIAANAGSGEHALTVTTLYGTSDPAWFTVQDPTPQIFSITPDVWEAGTTFSATITGSGFGNNPTVEVPYASVDVNSSDGSVINAMVTVSPNAPDGDQEVEVSSNGWGGQGFMGTLGGQQTSNGWIVTLFQPVASATVAISSTSIPDDRITVQLGPQGMSGTLTVQLLGGTTHTVYQGTRTSGTHDISFNIPDLPNGEFTEVQATWAVEGQSPSATNSYHFKVLGDYTQTKYNTPGHNVSCSGQTVPFTYLTAQTCQAIDCPSAQTASGQALTGWLSEVIENGTGLHPSLGIVWGEP